MLALLLNTVMDWALARPENKGKGYEGEDMAGWAYTIKDENGKPYLSRLLLPRIKLPLVGTFRPMLHKFHRADKDQDLHNHPWQWAKSIVLTGGYIEERLVPLNGNLMRTVRRLVTRFNSLNDKDYHRVESVADNTFTLFISGPRTQEWGFLTADGQHIPWKEYLGIS